MKQQTDEALAGYRWIDRKNGVVAVPIEQAMDMLLNKGLLKATTRPATTPSGGRP